jgi:PAS domain S-box-containing protein
MRNVTERKMEEEKFRFLDELNQSLHPPVDQEKIMAAAVRMLGEYLGADRCAYAEVEANEKYLEITNEYTRGELPSVVGRFSVDDLGPEALRLLRANHPYVVNDIEAEASARIVLSTYLQAGVRALMCAPLSKNGRYVARITVSQKTPRQWEPWEIDLVANVANRCWEAVQWARAVKGLRESEERYRAFIANTSEAIWRFEMEQPNPINLPEDEQIERVFKYAYLAECNDTMARFYGYETADQIIGRRIGDLVVRSDPRNIDQMRAFKRAGFKLTDSEMREVDRFGNTKYFLTNLIGIVENGAVVRVWGTKRDITERKQAEGALRESEELFSKAFRASPDGLAITRLSDGVILEVNDSWLNLLGYESDEVIGKGWTHFGFPVDPADRRRVVAIMEEQGYIRDFEMAVNRKSGETILVRISIEPIELRGEPCLVTIVHDITQRKKIEEEREHLLREEKVLREEAEAANRMKDEFLATISHELRTPLTSILGWARILTGGGLTTPQARHALEVIAQSAQSQRQLIEDILDTSGIITGRFKLDAQPVEIEHIFHAAVDVIKPSAEAKGIALSEVIEAPDGLVLGDDNRLRQAVWNLLSNAVKFTSKGGRIEARLARAEGQIEITVKDTGIGIEPKFLPHVFDRFRQANASSTREYGGLGIGLAIVRHIVEMHGGGVLASSPGKGQGATFKIKLPLISGPGLERLEKPGVEPLPPAKEHKILETSGRLDGVRVLLVEDNLDTLDMLKFIFAEAGAEVITATSVDDALEALERFKPDALISDIAMPDRDGYDLIREVRSRRPEQGGKIPAVAVTAYARAEDRVRVLAAGFQMHIAKPIAPGELIAVVASLTGHIHYGSIDVSGM